MIYNQDEDNFLSDKKIGEVSQDAQPRRRGGAYVEEAKPQKAKQEKYVQESEDDDSYKKVIIVAAVVLLVLCIGVGVIVANMMSGDKDTKPATSTTTSQNTTNTSKPASTSKPSNSTSINKEPSNTTSSSTSSTSGVSSSSDTYDAYSIKIESVVATKGGNFFNNNEKIKGDKAYVEYKQISGLKDKSKEQTINAKLKELSTSLYDKNYLSDGDTLFIDIHTKLSVNFNTLSYVVIKTYEDIEGEHKNEKAVSYNIRLDTMEEIKFEDLFTSSANIKNMYPSYSSGKVKAFYFDPKTIYVYEGIKEVEIDMSKNSKDIAIYNKYKADNLFESTKVSKQVFTILDSTVSTQTKDRAFESNTTTKKEDTKETKKTN